MPNINLTKDSQSGMFVVFVNGEEVSSHSEEKEAVENAVNAKFDNPNAEVYYQIDSKIKVDVSGVSAPQPEPESDVAVESIQLVGQDFVEGGDITVQMVVQNIGETDLGSFSYTLRLGTDLQIEGSIDSLVVGDQVVLEHTFLSVPAGEHVVEGIADSNNAIAEPITTNNKKAIMLTVAEACYGNLLPIGLNAGNTGVMFVTLQDERILNCSMPLNYTPKVCKP